MRTYAYEALRTDGTRESGQIEASDHDHAVTVLARRDLFALEVRAEAKTSSRRSLSTADLALGLRMLSTLLESGLPMARSLMAFSDVAPASWRPYLPDLQVAVREGKGLATAMEASSLAIPPVVIGMLHAGEAGGNIAKAVTRAADLIESAAAVKSAIRSALAYPVILAAAGFASLLVLVGVVLPRFETILNELGQSLPASTRFIIDVSTSIRNGAIPAAAALLVLTAAWKVAVSNDAAMVRWHEALLKIPVIGPVRLAAATSRVSAALAALLDSGVPLPKAITHAARTAGDAAIAKRLLIARDRIVAGDRIFSAIGECAAMTSTAVRLVRTGEETGRLASMLNHASAFERDRVAQTVRTSVRMLEPAMILLFSIVVAVVAAALLQAVYSVRPI